LCKTFKRIDISFLQMAAGGKPVFAIMPYELYRAGGKVFWNRKGYRMERATNDPIFGELFQSAAYSQAARVDPASDPFEVMRQMQEDWMARRSSQNIREETLQHTALRKIPETVEAFIEQKRKGFDKIWVAEEASWQPAPKDPLVLGQKGQFFYLMAQFDATKLESYVRAEFGL
jgi:hypothetical protein